MTTLATARTIASDIKIAHSVFALPFAVLGAVMAAAPAGTAVDWRRFAGQLILVVLAMVFARTVAMLSNRLLDRQIDARNPRTAARALPAGRLSSRQAATALGLSSALFIAVCLAFGLWYGNWWPTVLGPPVLVWISAYALTKRFTAACHLYLGSSLAMSPLAAALAVNPDALITQPALWLLAAMVLTWVAGFDVIYALQDVEIDRSQGLHSMPARLGLGRAMWASRALHAVSAACLIVAVLLDPRLRWLTAVAVVCVVALLVWEHLTVRRWGTTKIAMAFFTANGVISCLLGAAAATDVLLG
ncbi:MAG: UbiA family prenyltransferase [Deltaproteobacteria bacterium]|nr:UbiA family prenyltransferase [Deltaproteobacteria bacterium]